MSFVQQADGSLVPMMGLPTVTMEEDGTCRLVISKETSWGGPREGEPGVSPSPSSSPSTSRPVTDGDLTSHATTIQGTQGTQGTQSHGTGIVSASHVQVHHYQQQQPHHQHQQFSPSIPPPAVPNVLYQYCPSAPAGDAQWVRVDNVVAGINLGGGMNHADHVVDAKDAKHVETPTLPTNALLAKTPSTPTLTATTTTVDNAMGKVGMELGYSR